MRSQNAAGIDNLLWPAKAGGRHNTGTTAPAAATPKKSLMAPEICSPGAHPSYGKNDVGLTVVRCKFFKTLGQPFDYTSKRVFINR